MIVYLFDIGALTKAPNSSAKRIIIQWFQCRKIAYHVVKIKELSFVQHNLVIVTLVSVVPKLDEFANTHCLRYSQKHDLDQCVMCTPYIVLPLPGRMLALVFKQSR